MLESIEKNSRDERDKMEAKANWRKKMRKIMEEVEDQKDQGEKVLQQIKEWEVFKQAKRIACFSSMGKEIETAPLLESILKEKKQLFLPKTFPFGKMGFFQVKDLEKRIKGPFGILEPTGEEEKATPFSLDLIFVPALAIDLKGNRLGQGGGYYDRYLPKTRGVTAALVLTQQVQKGFPCEKTDFLVKYIIETKEIIKVQN